MRIHLLGCSRVKTLWSLEWSQSYEQNSIATVSTIEGSEKISELCALFWLVVHTVDLTDRMVANEVYDAVLKLVNNKDCGMDYVSAEHLSVHLCS